MYYSAGSGLHMKLSGSGTRRNRRSAHVKGVIVPGLFGVVSLAAVGEREYDEMCVALSRMAAVLRHHDEDVLEVNRHDPRSLLVGRIGLSHTNPLPWPSPPDDGSDYTTRFAAGAMLDPGPAVARNPLPDHAQLRGWRGFYAAVVTHSKTPVTLIIADRRASVPIYYAHVGSWLLFAPEVKGVQVAEHANREVDLGAMSALLAQGHLLGAQTLFSNVRRLRGGELLRIENGRVLQETYWKFAPGSAVGDTSARDLEHEFGELVEHATARHLGDPASAIIFLSGGADSRGILGAALASVSGDGQQLHTITWGIDPDRPDSDVLVAGRLAAHARTQHRFWEREIRDYRDRFTEVNRLIDGVTALSALHPGEHRFMVDLRAAGFQRALRGDEVSGWSRLAATHEEALSLVYLRRLRDAPRLSTVIRPEKYAAMCAASDDNIEEALGEVRALPPNQAKDVLYFDHRLQAYLQPASYWKQVELDQRNVLLDEPILDFLARVPEPLRIEKALYRRAIALRYPDLARFPFAQRDNLENWRVLLTSDTPVRQYVLDEMADRSSGIWEYLDREVLSGMIRELEAPAESGKRPRGKWDSAKVLGRRTLERVSPRLWLTFQSHRHKRPVFGLLPATILFRALVLKDWHDTFVTGRTERGFV
jgi:asparagine synthetase B (glutamine-hydrolysing)